MSKFSFNKKGFGLIEVMAASVVLGFLIVGLLYLQMGNRESILRIRVRDAATNIAQEVIDSIAAEGVASITEGSKSLEYPKKRIFKGSFAKENGHEVPVEFNVVIEVKEADDILQTADNESVYSKTFNESASPSDKIGSKHEFAKNVKVTVTWMSKNSPQSINLSSVVR